MDEINFYNGSTHKVQKNDSIFTLEKINVDITTSVVEYLDELITVLFYDEYFSFEQNAQLYVEKIYDFMEYSLPSLPHKIVPKSLKKLGSFYIFYKANNRTTWYIFFEKHENRYLITHITNNHIGDINLLNVLK